MARIGNVCPCGRMIFTAREVVVTDPENTKATFVLPDLMFITCLGCGQDLLTFKGKYQDVPVSPRLPEGQERLRESVKKLFAFKYEPVETAKTE